MKLIAFLVVLMTLTLSGCETMQGLGRDIQKAGDALESKAKGDEKKKKQTE